MYIQKVKLKYQKWEAEMLPLFGANVISLKHDGFEILRSPENMTVLTESPYLYGTPLLFPPNRTEGGRFCFDGVYYSLELNEPQRNNHIHGKMFDAPFSILKTEMNSVTCVYEDCGERYPFPFRMTIICSLGEDGLTQTIEIENTSDSDMPVLLGLHTTFAEPHIFSVPLGKRWETNENYIPTGRLLEIEEHERLYIRGCSPKRRIISGFFTAAGNTARIGNYFYHTSENFSQWILYNGGGDKGFLCIEPQSGPVNGLNMKDGHLRLESRKYVMFWTRISDR
ncbi:MAG TPA: aldose 1-epimerase [Clostridiales bacterium]|nr:aldose 1-epimerase [Clostridiales bacterium]